MPWPAPVSGRSTRSTCGGSTGLCDSCSRVQTAASRMAAVGRDGVGPIDVALLANLTHEYRQTHVLSDQHRIAGLARLTVSCPCAMLLSYRVAPLSFFRTRTLRHFPQHLAGGWQLWS